MNCLSNLADIASILTAAVAVGTWIYFMCVRSNKREKLEEYLRSEKDKNADNGQRSILHLMVKVGLTEDEILQASFRSKCINRLIAANPETNRAEAILLEYKHK